MDFHIRSAGAEDAGVLLGFIRELAEFEQLAHEVVATDADIEAALFGERAVAEAVIGEADGAPVAFALFFPSFSTFAGKPGLYLEDLYVQPEHRGHGYGTALLRHLARLAVERGCARFEWSVLDWNENAIRTYTRIGARPMDAWTVYRCDGDALRELAGP